MVNDNELGASALARYVGHRKIILDFLDGAISKEQDLKKFPLERAVHHLVFPMKATSDNLPYHEQNLWIIDEGLTFHSYIASDKPLNTRVFRECFGTATGPVHLRPHDRIRRGAEGHPITR